MTEARAKAKRKKYHSACLLCGQAILPSSIRASVESKLKMPAGCKILHFDAIIMGKSLLCGAVPVRLRPTPFVHSLSESGRARTTRPDVTKKDAPNSSGPPPLLSSYSWQYCCNLQQHTNEMTSTSSVPHGIGNGAFEHASLLPTVGNTETFLAFLNEFSEGSWPLKDATEKQAILSHTGKYHMCQELYSKEEAETMRAPSTSFVTRAQREHFPFQAPTDVCDLSRGCPSKSAETCTDSSPVADKDGTTADAPCFLEEICSRRILLHSCVRKLTNPTYLRRMHMSREDSEGLFPDVKRSLDFVYRTKMTRRESLSPFKNGTCVHLYDIEGRRWPVTLEWLRTAGQRHVRLNQGWAEVCRANGFSIGTCVRLARWKQGLSPSLVTFSIVQAKGKKKLEEEASSHGQQSCS